MGKSSNDRALRIYNEVLGLDRLHYGMWLEEDELSYENLKKAQIRYEDYLIENIPEGVKTILDVGCGSGAVTRDIAHLTKGSVIGVDGSFEMIRVAKNILKESK